MTDMQKRLNVLEQQTHHQCGNDQRAANGKGQVFGKMREELRVKRGHLMERDPMEFVESKHMRSEHHGIGSHKIALIYGDPDQIPINSNVTGVAERWRKFSGISSKLCAQLYQSPDDQRFCEPRHHNFRPLYMTGRGNTRYQYFKKAEWMNTNSSWENYELRPDGGLVVKKSGLYIVHASIIFSEVDKVVIPHFGVYKRDSAGNNRQLITKCLVPAIGADSHGDNAIAPCQTWQLTYLNAGDQVYMAIGGYIWFRVEKETFHLALIRLNNELLW